jgi:hypothetical protein
MAYVHKLINDDEKLIGIARLHWIYVIQGLVWFFALAGAGYGLSWLMNRGLQATMNLTSNPYIPSPFMGLSNGIMIFMLVAGALIFGMYVIKILATQVALTDRRIIHKHGLIFVNVHQIDLEEIRGENLDLGYFGRILGYAVIMLDCRFIGDIRLPAIENPEAFIRALHDRRAHAQDSLNLVAGKSNNWTPVNLVNAEEAGGDEPKAPPTPEIRPSEPPQQPEISPTPQPEVSPTPPDQIPTPPNEPMPDAPPPMNKDHDKKSVQNTFENMRPEISRRIEEIKDELKRDMTFSKSDEIEAPKSLEQIRAEGIKEPELDVHKTKKETQEDNAKNQDHPISKEQIAKVVEEITPQIAQEVVKEMTREGLIKPPEPAVNDDNNIDNMLVKDFDDAALDKDSAHHENKPRLEHSIH